MVSNRRLYPHASYVDLEVVVVLVAQRLVIVVNSAVAAAVVCDQEVVRDIARDHVGSGGAGSIAIRVGDTEGGDIWLPVPAVDRA